MKSFANNVERQQNNAMIKYGATPQVIPRNLKNVRVEIVNWNPNDLGNHI